MNRSSSLLTLVPALGLLAAALAAHGQGRPQPTEEGLAKLRAAGHSAPLGICPVQLMGQGHQNVAEVLALVLESKGMDHLDLVAPFTPPADAAWDAVPAAFGEFARGLAQAPEYLLFAEYVGEPRTGPKEVRFIVVDRAGNLVLVDRQTTADPDFKRTAGADPDPMGCSVLVGERFFSRLGWSERSIKDGKFAKLWAEKSGTPTDAERQAMDKRCAELGSKLKTARISVLPPLVNNASAVDVAPQLAELLAARFGCQATAQPEAAALKLEPTSNEQKRLWDLARQTREHLRAHAPDADYVLQADYLLDPGKAAHTVHFVICDRTGEWVVVDFQNNQHPDFKRVDPKSVADCARLTVERLAARAR